MSSCDVNVGLEGLISSCGVSVGLEGLMSSCVVNVGLEGLMSSCVVQRWRTGRPRIVLWYTTLDWKSSYRPVVYNVGLEGLVSSCGVQRWTGRPRIVLWYKHLSGRPCIASCALPILAQWRLALSEMSPTLASSDGDGGGQLVTFCDVAAAANGQVIRSP